MPYSVYAHNIKEGLGLAVMPAIAEAIDRQNADVVVLSDAYSVRNPEHNKLHGAQAERIAVARTKFETMGYAYTETEYVDPFNPWHHDRNLVVLTRDAVNAEPLMLGTRNGILVTMPRNIHLIALHGHDRDPQARHMQFRAAAQLAARLSGQQAIIGDYNEMHGERLPEKLVRRLPISTVAQRAAGLLERYGLARTAQLQKKLLRSADYAGRAALMANNRDLVELEEKGFRDADPSHTPTFPASHPLFQLDRCMTSEGLIVNNFRVLAKTMFSDHLGITLDLLLR